MFPRRFLSVNWPTSKRCILRTLQGSEQLSVKGSREKRTVQNPPGAIKSRIAPGLSQICEGLLGSHRFFPGSLVRSQQGFTDSES